MATNVIQHSTSEVVELRQYTLYPSARETLIELFERIFIAAQEEAGMEIVDQFRDLDDPDRFVWLRGFPDMPARATASTAFYDSAAWQQNRDAANATMIDWENVLLLRPVEPYRYPATARPPAGTTTDSAPLVVLTVCPLDSLKETLFPAFFTSTLAPALEAAGAEILASYASEHSPNSYPRLTIREGESVFVWLLCFADQSEYDRHLAVLERSKHWTDEIASELTLRLTSAPESTRLSPTRISRLRTRRAGFDSIH